MPVPVWDDWKTQGFRQSVTSKLEDEIHRAGVQVARSCSEMEKHVFMRAKSQEEYEKNIEKLINHIRAMSHQVPVHGNV